MQNRIANRPELHTLILAGQKARAPQTVVERLIGRVTRTLGDHHDKRRKVLILAAKAIGEPRADARTASQLMPGLEKRYRRIVVDLLGVHGFDEAEIVG